MLEYIQIARDMPEWQLGLCILAVVLVVALLRFAYEQLKGPALFGDAQFATRREVEKAGLFGDDGIPIGKWGWFGRIMISASDEFLALFAPTRTGKGVGLAIPTLLAWMKSVVVMDIKKENFDITSLFRKMIGQEVYCFNPFSTTTHRWNPLGHIKELPEYERVPEIMAIGYTLYPHTDDNGGIWANTPRNLFVGLVLYLLETDSPVISIGEALRTVYGDGSTAPQKHLQKLIDDRVKEGKPLTALCANFLGEFIKAPGNTAGSVLISFTAPLGLWRSPVVDAATEESDFDVRELRRKLMSIYLVIPPDKLDQSQMIANLFFSQVIKLNMDKLPEHDPTIKHQVLVLMDEALAAGHLTIMDKAIPYIAGFGIRLVTIAQSPSQVKKPVAQGGYGADGGDVFLDNHSLKMTFRPANIRIAREISDVLGDRTVKGVTRNLRRRLDGSESDQRRPLLLPQELMQLSPKYQIVTTSKTRPIRCRKIQFFREIVFMRRLFWACPELKPKFGMPSRKRLTQIVSEGKLAAPVPEITIRKPEFSVASAEPESETEGVGMDFTELPEVPAEPMSEESAANWADKFCASMGLGEPEVQQ